MISIPMRSTLHETNSFFYYSMDPIGQQRFYRHLVVSISAFRFCGAKRCPYYLCYPIRPYGYHWHHKVSVMYAMPNSTHISDWAILKLKALLDTTDNAASMCRSCPMMPEKSLLPNGVCSFSSAQ